MTIAAVLEVTTGNFQSVVEGSMQRPVLLDFWAEWCGPCRTLGPVLDKLVAEFGGAFTLGKVDTEAQPELAQLFQVQSIPFCVLIDGGRPVDGFRGALGESEVRQFLQRHGVTALVTAADAAPVVDVDSPAARFAAARQAAADGQVEPALQALAGIPEEDPMIDAAGRLRDAIAFLQASLRDDAVGAEGLLAAARHQFLAKDLPAAMETILAAVAADKTFMNGLARRAMLLCFLVLGEADERCDDYRRRLATLLY